MCMLIEGQMFLSPSSSLHSSFLPFNVLYISGHEVNIPDNIGQLRVDPYLFFF